MRRIVLVVLMLGISATMSATKIRHLSLDEVRDQAESIFIGRVVSGRERPVMKGQMKATEYLIAVEEVLYGAVSTPTTVTYAGTKTHRVEAAPLLQEGAKYVFFRGAKQNNTTIGWGQGVYGVETAKVGNAQRTVLISGDGEALMSSGGRLVRGDQVTVQNGVLVPVADSVMEQPRKTTKMVATNADGTTARRLPASAPSLKAAATFATLDELRVFVRAKQSATR